MIEVILTDENFEEEVIKSDIPVLVDFWAQWCAPCRIIAPTILQISQEYSKKIKVAKCDIDACPKTANTQSIQSIPTLKVFNKGEPVSQKMGVISKQAIIEMFSQLI